MSGTAGRLWSKVYGAALVVIGIGCAAFVVHEIMNPPAHESLAFMIYRLAMLCFISFGAIIIGIERILKREVQAL